MFKSPQTRLWCLTSIGILTGIRMVGCNSPEPNADEIFEVAEAPLPQCEIDSSAPICNPDRCRPLCQAKICGASDGCGGICRTGSCPVGDTCGGSGLVGQCGHRSVDLSMYQTSLKSQGGRDTCSVFAATAALEAAYMHKYGLRLDLSEQYLNHVQKSFWLDPNARLPAAEIQPETNGGGNIPWQFAVLTRYGLPPEANLPYIGDISWQNSAGWTHSNGSLIPIDQRRLDDFMLSATAVTYFTPTPITATVLPQAALDSARFRLVSSREAGAAVQDLNWYRGELSAGREIAFDVMLSSSRPGRNGVWMPGSSNLEPHAMLMIGFDDSKQAFLVKNSWQSKDWFSYAWVTSGAVQSAMTIIDVTNPYVPFGTYQNPQLFLGRWQFDHDGWHGILDIYRLPDSGMNFALDRRVGTYFGPDGVARRVNATISGNRIDFYFDWGVTDLPLTALQGMHFTGYVFGSDHLAMAGTMVDDRNGNSYAFHALKGRSLGGVPSSAGLSSSAFVGTWGLSADGVPGTLVVRSVHSISGVLSGTHTDEHGVVSAVTGVVGPDPRAVNLTIETSTPMTLVGFVNGHEIGVMSGAITSTGPTGFFAYRKGPVPRISGEPNNPLEGDDVTLLACLRKPQLPQCN